MTTETTPHVEAAPSWLSQTFTGKKTYATAIVTILGAAITYFMGEATAGSAINTALIGLMGMFLRAGVEHTAHCIKCEIEAAKAQVAATVAPPAA